MNVTEAMEKMRKESMSLNPYRNQVIEEVAQHVEKLMGFGKELAAYIREMKQ
jgi:hypothetical protein